MFLLTKHINFLFINLFALILYTMRQSYLFHTLFQFFFAKVSKDSDTHFRRISKEECRALPVIPIARVTNMIAMITDEKEKGQFVTLLPRIALCARDEYDRYDH